MPGTQLNFNKCLLVMACLVFGGAAVVASDIPVFERAEDGARYQIIARKNRNTPNGELRRAIAGHIREPPPPLIPREDLVRERRIRQVVLSPDGLHVAYLLREISSASLWLMSTQTLETQKLLDTELRSFFGWSSDSRYLFFDAGGLLSCMAIDGAFPAYLLPLGDRGETRFERVDAQSPHHVFLSRRLESGQYALLRIGIDGEPVEIYRSEVLPDDFLTGSNGQMAWVKRPQKGQQVLFRLTGGEEVPVAAFDLFDAASLLKWEEGAKTLWLRSRMSGDLIQVFKWQLDGKPLSVFGDPDGVADVHGVVLNRDTGLPFMAVLRTPHYRALGIEPQAETHLARIRKAMGGRDLHVTPSQKGGRWLVQQFGSAQPQPRVAIYDPEMLSLQMILEAERANSAVATMAALPQKVPFSFRTGDDFTVHGYVTLPKGAALRESPLVVVPHGGPFAQTAGNFDERVHFLANRGMVVVEPNFRGSTGYGLDYLTASNRDFGKGIVYQDIVDSVHFMLSMGVGNPKKLAILGHSFGGFATFCGLAFNPDLFQLGIASAPPPDLVSCMDALEPETDMGHGITRDDALRPYVVDLNDLADQQRLRSKSPVTHLDKIEKPLLIMAGKRDRAVPVDQVRAMALGLRKSAGSVSLFVAKDEGHQFTGPLVQRAAYYLTERMLANRFGTRYQPLGDEAIFRILANSLELDGHGFLRPLKAVHH